MLLVRSGRSKSSAINTCTQINYTCIHIGRVAVSRFAPVRSFISFLQLGLISKKVLACKFLANRNLALPSFVPRFKDT